jgi:serine/threonine-protein kinase RsbT
MKRADQFRQRPLQLHQGGKPEPELLKAGPLPSRPRDRARLNSTDPRSSPEEIRIPIGGDPDIVRARQEGRRIAGTLGFSVTDLVLVATAISELARNIVRYAGTGEIGIRPVANSGHNGIEIIARDEGPGIKDVEQVMQVGFSTSASLGLGLPGVRRLMDEFEIQSKLGEGTAVITRKWKI